MAATQQKVVVARQGFELVFRRTPVYWDSDLEMTTCEKNNYYRTFNQPRRIMKTISLKYALQRRK